MRSMKMLALAAVAAGALMAFIGAGTASASVACSTETTPCSSRWPNVTWTWSHSGPASLFIKELGGEGKTLDTCTGSSMMGTMINGTTTATVKGTVEAKNLAWTGCTQTTTTIAGGTLEIHNIAGTSNGTVTGSGFKVTVLAFGFISCVFETGEGAVLGTITEGKPAITHTESIWSRISGFGCPEKAEIVSTEALTSPANTTLVIEPN
jgi:hypothetical protein